MTRSPSLRSQPAALALTVVISVGPLSGCFLSSDDEFDPRGARSSSGFAADDDGWTITGDAQATSVKPDYSGTGGNPDGLIRAKDDVTGGVWYFQAPQKYLGTAGATYGRKLQFDLQTSNLEDPFDDYDVVLQGDGKTIVFDTPNNPGIDTWTSYSIPLDEDAGWRKIDSLSVEYVSAERFASFPPVTSEELRAVLGALTTFRIRGEFNTGEDTGALDNVRFGAE